MERPVVQWFSKSGPQISSIHITWEIVRNVNSQTHPRCTESETLRLGGAVQQSDTLQVILLPVKVENHSSRLMVSVCVDT